MKLKVEMKLIRNNNQHEPVNEHAKIKERTPRQPPTNREGGQVKRPIVETAPLWGFIRLSVWL